MGNWPGLRDSTSFIALVILLASCGGALAEAPIVSENVRPNVILIVADDLGWGDLGCYGSKFHRSPNLDELAAQGMRCTQAYAAAAICSPTRAALLTGKWPARLQLTDWLPGRGDRPDQKLLQPDFCRQLPLAETTLAEYLRQAGYATGCFGKWHLGGKGFGPLEQGFDQHVAGEPTEKPPGNFPTETLTAAAEKFMEENRERPFFVYLPHYAVHIPLQARREIIARYENSPQRPQSAGQQNNPIYAAMIEMLDDSLGRLRKKLADLKLSERTLIIFTSDNGGLATVEGPNTPATSNAPLREGKGYLYEGGIRVPLIFHWPNAAKPQTVCDTPVCSVDILPTVLEICGAKPAANLDGQSLARLLRQSGGIERDALYWHYPHYSNQGGRPSAAIRAGDWKLIEFYENGRRELFNLKENPGEGVNLADQQPQRVRELAAKLQAWRKSVAAQTMRPNPDYHPNPQAADGSVSMHASTAEVHGVMLRFEPLPHKDTLGYWVRPDDWASFEFEIDRPGEFQVELAVGCGNGSEGSEVAVQVGDATLTFIVEATGGFQKFTPRAIGVAKLDKAGRHMLVVKPITKPRAAVMDLQRIRLLPTKAK